MRAILTANINKLVKVYLRNGLNFTGRVINTQTESVALETRYSKIFIKLGEIAVISTDIVERNDPPPRNPYHPANQGYRR